MICRVSSPVLGLLIVIFLGLPVFALAQSLTYQPLVGIPGVSNGAGGFNSYINQLYFLSISLAALLAVIKIIIGGVKWMLTDIVTSKADAKNEIKGALLGLLLIVSAVLILGTINPQLKELNVLGGAPALRGLPSATTESAATQSQRPATAREMQQQAFDRAAQTTGAGVVSIPVAPGADAQLDTQPRNILQLTAPWHRSECGNNRSTACAIDIANLTGADGTRGNAVSETWFRQQTAFSCPAGHTRSVTGYYRVSGILVYPTQVQCIPN